VAPRSPHVRIAGSAILTYCSAECLQTASAPIEVIPEGDPPRRRHWPRVMLHVALGGACLLHLSGAPEPAKPVVPASHAVAPPVVPPEPPTFGPAWPPAEEDWAATIAEDAWIHPLDGPERRMPANHARVFGAERPGERPPECRSGHCGVDLGGEVWGEPIHAVHDGVVDRVQRGPNEDHGGLYVRLAHRNGTVFTQYFHLAAIPKWVQPGRAVKAGTVIGLLGDSGIKESEQHLHFTLSVKPAKSVNERFIDPESLIALWPLRIPGAGGMVSTGAAPGVPHSSTPRKKRRASLDRAERPAEIASRAESAPNAAPAP
jgi:hypothetical protein